MTKKFMRKESKRLSCRKKYKIERKVREHNRKQRKEKKKNPDKFRGRRSDPGIPNTLPFKDKILEEAAEIKRLQEEAKDKRRQETLERRKEQREGLVNKKRNIGTDINELVKSAEKRGAEFEKKNQLEKEQDKGTLSDRSAKSYYREFKKVVETADVILEVLDARDPLGTRCPQMEGAVTCHGGKRLVLVLNKADLVPRAVLERWLVYLRREHPTIVFKSSTQTQSNNLARFNVNALNSDAMKSSRCIGADVLMQLLKNYSRNRGLKTDVLVGVVGLPNVGKSSLINSLKRSKACGVGATPGFTKTMQEIQIDSKIRLLDSPGIVLPGGDLNDGAAVLRNAVNIETIDDPLKPVQAIYKRVTKQQLTMHYRLSEFNDFDEFMPLLAKRLGKLKKGGIPNIIQAAKVVLYDWTIGRIKYYTEAPTIPDTEVSATLVSKLGDEFALESLKDSETNMLSELPMLRPSETMCVDTEGPVNIPVEESTEWDEEKMEEMEEKDSEDEDSDDEMLPENVHINMEKVKSSAAVETDESKHGRRMPKFDPTKMSMKQYLKLVGKKNRKEKNRNVGRADSLLNAFENLGGITEDKSDEYSFKDYFDDSK